MRAVPNVRSCGCCRAWSHSSLSSRGKGGGKEGHVEEEFVIDTHRQSCIFGEEIGVPAAKLSYQERTEGSLFASECSSESWRPLDLALFCFSLSFSLARELSKNCCTGRCNWQVLRSQFLWVRGRNRNS
ncbi:unnamed protein product [Calypogeia fissa]